LVIVTRQRYMEVMAKAFNNIQQALLRYFDITIVGTLEHADRHIAARRKIRQQHNNQRD
jgi:hypothetical protein